MKPAQRERWLDEAIEATMGAIASHEWLARILVFKGARVLGSLLGAGTRMSLDIDAGLTAEFLREAPTLEEQRKRIETAFLEALVDHFSRQSEVRYIVNGVEVEIKPNRNGHPHGWNGFLVKIKMDDNLNAGVKGLQPVTIDLSHPEDLKATSVAELEVDGGVVIAYTLERIAGEKLRAFLQSLPTYVKKLSRHTEIVRAKDLYDLAVIVREVPVSNVAFWRRVTEEFVSACAGRLVDCSGLESFSENLEVTRRTYSLDGTIRDDIPFDEAWHAVASVVSQMAALGIFPLLYPLDDSKVGRPELGVGK